MAVTPNSIVTPQAVKSAAAVVSNANTVFTTTPSNAVKLLKAGENGARVTRIVAIPTESVTSNFLQLYRSKDNGLTKYICAVANGPVDQVSATDAPTPVEFGISDDIPMMLEAEEEVYVASGISKSYHVTAEYTDY